MYAVKIVNQGDYTIAWVISRMKAGRQNGLSVFQAVRATLDGNSKFMPVNLYWG